MNVVELFSGIGSQAKALKNIGIEHNIVATCEWNYHAIVAYDLIHNTDIKINEDIKNMSKGELVNILSKYSLSSDGKKIMTLIAIKTLSIETLRRVLSSIINTKNHVNITNLNGAELPNDIDLLTYSFPCQDLSNVGAFHGYNKGIDRNANNRSCMLWEVERILNERFEENLVMPKFLLLENVTALASSRHNDNFMEWQNVLKNMGYFNKIYKLNASDFGLPQNRRRLLMVSVFTNGNKKIENDIENYFDAHNLEDEKYRDLVGIDVLNIKDALKTNYDILKYKEEALECQPNATKSRITIWENNLQITNLKGEIKERKVATITTKQDRHPNSGNLFVEFGNGRSNFRYLTPRECFILMGFDEEDYEKIINDNCKSKSNHNLFTRDNLIKMAGNSIAVKVLEKIFLQLCEIENFAFTKEN